MSQTRIPVSPNFWRGLKCALIIALLTYAAVGSGCWLAGVMERSSAHFQRNTAIKPICVKCERLLPTQPQRHGFIEGKRTATGRRLNRRRRSMGAVQALDG